MLQLLICKSDTVKKVETPHTGAGTSPRAGHLSIPSPPVCFICLHLAVQGTLTRDKLRGGLIQVNPGHYGWVTPINCCAEALTEILQLTEHSSRSDALLARRREECSSFAVGKGHENVSWQKETAETVARIVSFVTICSTFCILSVLLFVFFLFDIRRR